MSTSTKHPAESDAEKAVYSFTLVLDDITKISVDIKRALCHSGCEDALLRMVDGKAMLDFKRAADSMLHAMLRAIRAVESCGLLIRIRQVVPPGYQAIRAVNALLDLRDERPDVVEQLRALQRSPPLFRQAAREY